MARPHLRIGMLLVLLMFMSGCIYSTTPEWGTGDGQLKVEINDNSADIQSELGDGFDESVPIVDCEGSKFKVTGLLISSTNYDSHPDMDNIESAMGAAVIIHTMTWNEASGVEEGTAGRINVKEWSSPVNPTEAVGSKLSENEDDWEVIGIIPGSENIADGLNVLEHWHQPIELSGYVLETDGVQSATEEGCELDGQGHGMVVTNIKTEQGIVSKNGDSDDEYSLGDTDIFGGWTFILFFLIVGIGGGVGLFIFSTMVIRQGARATAEALLGREGFAKAIQMKKDIKSSRKAGIESIEDRAARQRKSSPPPKKSKEKDVAIPGFSLDNVLAAGDSDDSPKAFGGGGSVVVTSEAKEIQQTQVVSSVVNDIPSSTPMPSAGVVTSQSEAPAKKGHFSASMVSSRSQSPAASNAPTKASKPVKRRAVKKRAAKPVEPEPAPVKNKRASISDDEEFSDFSF